MTHYLVSVHGSEDRPSYADEETMQAAFAAVDAFNHELQAGGAWVFAGGLLPASTASVVRASADGVARSDGPYLPGPEHLGGFWVIDAVDDDAAFGWAAKAAVACGQPVELRPFQGMPDD